MASACSALTALLRSRFIGATGACFATTAVMPSACHRFARNARANISTFSGLGSEKVEDELHREFPEARIARHGSRYRQRAKAFRDDSYRIPGETFDILVGTQMIAKGHDIPNVTLVGVISADIGLGMPDFRAAERTFQLLDTGCRARRTRPVAGPGRWCRRSIPITTRSGMRRPRISPLFTTRRSTFEKRCGIRRFLRWRMYWCEVRSRRTQCA